MLRKPLIIRRIAGRSMEPNLNPGTLVVARGFLLHLKPYDVVVVRHKGTEKIKRILHIRKGLMYLVGDNPAHSTDSRQFGWISTAAVIGKVMWPTH